MLTYIFNILAYNDVNLLSMIFSQVSFPLERLDDAMIVDLLYAQIVSDIYRGSVRISSHDSASVRTLLGKAQIPLDLSCRTTSRTTCRRPGCRQVGDQVSDFFSAQNLSETWFPTFFLLKTCRKPGFKQVLSKIDVMEFGHNRVNFVKKFQTLLITAHKLVRTIVSDSQFVLSVFRSARLL